MSGWKNKAAPHKRRSVHCKSRSEGAYFMDLFRFFGMKRYHYVDFAPGINQNPFRK